MNLTALHSGIPSEHVDHNVNVRLCVTAKRLEKGVSIDQLGAEGLPKPSWPTLPCIDGFRELKQN